MIYGTSCSSSGDGAWILKACELSRRVLPALDIPAVAVGRGQLHQDPQDWEVGPAEHTAPPE